MSVTGTTASAQDVDDGGFGGPEYIPISLQASNDDLATNPAAGAAFKASQSADTPNPVTFTITAVVQEAPKVDTKYTFVYLPLRMADLTHLLQLGLDGPGDAAAFLTGIKNLTATRTASVTATAPAPTTAPAATQAGSALGILLQLWYWFEGFPPGKPNPFVDFPPSITISANSNSGMVSFTLSSDEVTAVSDYFILSILYSTDKDNNVTSVGACLLPFLSKPKP